MTRSNPPSAWPGARSSIGPAGPCPAVAHMPEAVLAKTASSAQADAPATALAGGVQASSGSTPERDTARAATKPGTFHYGCLVPGHFEAAMKGRIEVVR